MLRPSFRKALRWTLPPLCVVVLLGGGIVGFHEWTVLSECTGSPACTYEGDCARLLVWRDGVDTECGPSTQKHCRESWACFDGGRCTLEDSDCVATTDEDCRMSTGCAYFGLCEAEEGRCIASESADCRASMCCRDLGRCSLVGSNCAVGAEQDCGQGKKCVRDGKSAANPWGCVAVAKTYRRDR